MHGLIEWFTRNGVAANLLMAAIILSGVYTLMSRRIGVEIFPEFPSNYAHISVPYRGATPEEAEESVVIRIEEAIADVEGIERILSSARESSGRVSVEIDRDYDRRNVLDDLKNRVDAISTFPEDAEEPSISLDQSFRSVISVVLSGDLSERDLRTLGERVRDQVAALPEVTDADLQGIRRYEISIQVTEATLQRHGLTFDQLARSLRNRSIDVSAGSMRTPSGDVVLRTRGRAYTGEEFAEIVVLTREDGTRLTLGDIADIHDGFQINPFIARFNGERCVLITVTREGNQSAIRLADQVKAYMEEIRPSLPPGITIGYWGDLSRIVRGRLETLLDSGWKSMLMVFLVLALFLRPSIAFWTVIGIPVCFLGTLATMPFLGVTINIASLFGFILVLGVVVDDAIVTGENIFQHQRRGSAPLLAAVEGAKEVAIPVIFGVLTTMLAFVPLLMGTGFSMQYSAHIALVVIPVLAFSLIESKLILPAHLRHCRFDKQWDNPFSHLQKRFALGLETFVEKVYQPALDRSLRWRYLTMAACLGILVVLISVIAAGHIQRVAFPRVESERATCRLTMQEGTAIEVTEREMDRIERIANEMKTEFVGPDGVSIIEDMISSVGGQGLTSSRKRGSQGETHLGEITFYITAPEERAFKMGTNEIVSIWRERIGPIVGSKELYFRAEIGRGGEPIDVQLTGPDIDDLVAASEEVSEHLTQYPGLFDFSTSLDESRDEVQLSIKPEAEQFGLSLADLARQVRQAFYGEEIQRIQRGRDDLRVMLRYPEAERNNLETLNAMRIRTPEGGEVPFNSVAEATLAKSFPGISRIDRNRAVNVTADADKERADIPTIQIALTTFLDELKTRYPDINYSFEGEAREKRDSAEATRLGWILILFSIYTMLAIPFRSYIQPLIVMSVIPFGLIGAVLGHIIEGLPLSFLSYFGMLALAGVVVNDSLVLVDYVNRRIKEGVPVFEAVSRAGAARFRAIILTSLTTFAGLYPLISMQSTQSQFLIPMAISLGYGILFATGITLFLVPINYLILDDLKRLFTREEATTLKDEALVNR